MYFALTSQSVFLSLSNTVTLHIIHSLIPHPVQFKLPFTNLLGKFPYPPFTPRVKRPSLSTELQE